MAEVSTIGLDVAKAAFHSQGADARGQKVFSRRLTRAKLLEFFAAHPCCVIALEVCGGARSPRRAQCEVLGEGAHSVLNAGFRIQRGSLR